jgi:hypothetical protein
MNWSAGCPANATAVIKAKVAAPTNRIAEVINTSAFICDGPRPSCDSRRSNQLLGDFVRRYTISKNCGDKQNYTHGIY